MPDIDPRVLTSPNGGDVVPGHKAGHVRLPFVNFRLAGTVLAGVLTISWFISWKEIDDRHPLTRTQECPTAQILGLAFSPDGKAIAASRFHESVVLRKVASRESITRLIACPIDAFVVVFSPDGRYLALGGTQADVMLCDLKRNGAALPLGIPVHQISSLAFSPDGGTLAVASDTSNEIILWDLAKKQARAILRGHESPVLTLAYSPDGSLASAAASDRVIIIWDVSAAQSRRRLDLADGPVRGARLRPGRSPSCISLRPNSASSALGSDHGIPAKPVRRRPPGIPCRVLGEWPVSGHGGP